MEEIKIRGPKQGYLNDEKAKYRKNVWENIFKVSGDLKNKKALIFPANNDEEIKILLSAGIQEKNIFACDENPAVLASSKWRKQFPKIKTLGVSLEKAILRLQKNHIKIDMVNFDFCSNLCESVFNDVLSFIKTCAPPKFTFAVTILKGRESNLETILAKMLFQDIKGRVDRFKILINFLVKNCNIRLLPLFQSEYKSGRQYMSYGVARIVCREKILEDVVNVFENKKPHIKRVLAIDSAFHKAEVAYGYKTNLREYSKKKEKRYKRRRIEVLSNLQDRFFKEKVALGKEIETTTETIEGWRWKTSDGIEWLGEQPVILYRGNGEALEAFCEIEQMKRHRLC